MNRLLAIAVSICSILACRFIHYVRAGHVSLVYGVVQVTPQRGSIRVRHFKLYSVRSRYCLLGLWRQLANDELFLNTEQPIPSVHR